MTNTTGCPHPHIWEDGTESLAIRYPHTWDDGTEAVAIFSNDDSRNYRYLIEKIWSPGLPILMFIMAHPSTATESCNDNAVSTCENRARNHYDDFGGTNFGGVCVTNLFAFVQNDTNNYERVDDQNGTENLRIIKEYARRPDTTIVCSWGNEDDDNRFVEQATIIKNMLLETEYPLHQLKLLKNGQPRKPSRFDSTVDFSIWED